MDDLFHSPPALAGLTFPGPSSGPTGVHQRPSWLACHDHPAGVELFVRFLETEKPERPERERIQTKSPASLLADFKNVSNVLLVFNRGFM